MQNNAITIVKKVKNNRGSYVLPLIFNIFLFYVVCLCHLFHFACFFFLKGLVNARKSEIESEDHMKKLAEREQGRLTHEIRRLEKELEDLKEKRNIFEVRIFVIITQPHEIDIYIINKANVVMWEFRLV